MKDLSQNIYHKALQKNLFPAFKHRPEKGEKRPKEDMTTWMVFQLLPLMSAEEQWEIAQFFLSQKTKNKYKGKVPVGGSVHLWKRFPKQESYLEPDVLLEFDFEAEKQLISIEIKVAHDAGLANQLKAQEKVLKEYFKDTPLDVTSLTIHKKEGLIGKNQTWGALSKYAHRSFQETNSEKVRFWAENIQALLSRVYFLKEFQGFNFKDTPALRKEIKLISKRLTLDFFETPKIENFFFMKEKKVAL